MLLGQEKDSYIYIYAIGELNCWLKLWQTYLGGNDTVVGLFYHVLSEASYYQYICTASQGLVFGPMTTCGVLHEKISDHPYICCA